MANNQIIGSIGYITKEETLAPYQSQYNHPQMILEDMHPFPGYYEFYNIPRNEIELIPRSLFIVLRTFRYICEDDVIRMAQRIKKNHPELQFDAVLGHITLLNELRTVLRIKMENLDRLGDLLKLFEKEGLDFDKKRKVREFTTKISVRKYLEMEELDDGIYKDTDMPYTYYLKQDYELEWEDFKEITKVLKTNFEYKSFDAARGTVYVKEGLVDLIRIYDVEATLDKLKLLQERYKKEIEQYEPPV
ncbi:MAG: hypothetical protein K9I68_00685 [Bacteroidales bacterium]|nr:hypothetical protein [Bacteroidales bacterium]MCF8338109.1 hypothetical protein [Bacteroidales bacterium]